ncbi:hypothetical protein Stsp02_04070 [Streptomyces sp. NBRC 14336]|uniref:DUF1707 SHOCT-like domain-containing protein n=1 Tax=Streptomyces sp. NBRC 14336 TaxID=3030992 RepID=UPI0024A50966|nr:DUF1707 domain-containing protein [Streptomyces sp. NBRC 14336]GLW44745.1 hypothetical protein Stsp02_04070 [Streptomyces sp. NBRC 14336]
MDLEKQTAPTAATEPRVKDVPASELPASELRASDADRDRIADILREALAEGRLTAEEHSERVEGVLNARTVGELEVFIKDLPAAHARRAAPAYTPAPSRPTGGPAEPDDTAVAVFSSAVRKGRWRPGRRIHAYAIFGSVEIDLSEALFEYQQVVIKAFAVFGSVEVRVPENVSLRGTGGGVLGSFEVESMDAEDAAAPVIYVDGWAVLGSVEGRPRRGRLVTDILDRVHAKVERHLRKHL